VIIIIMNLDTSEVWALQSLTSSARLACCMLF